MVSAVFALLAQVACNFANDYGDFVRGADVAGPRVGPARAVASGWVPARVMCRAAVLVAAVAFAVGLLLVPWGGWMLVGVGAACMAACLAYTGGPWPLAYKGLGDVFVVVFFGFVAVLFSAFVQCGKFPGSGWWGGLGCGVLAANILVANNARDRLPDARAGKRTLVVRWGWGWARAQFAVALGVALGVVPVALFWRCGFSAWVLLPMALGLVAVALARAFWRAGGGDAGGGAAFVPFLGRSAVFLLAYGVLLAAGIVLGAAR
jgi:1,4-dihydroxy-2-naphthoate octaprenyltransferase